MKLVPRNDYFFDDFFEDLFVPTYKNNMKCDIYEKDGQYHIDADMPGFDKNDITLSVDNGYLTITAEKNNETKEEDKNYIRRERSSAKISRSFYLGDVDMDNVNAEFKDGSLHVILPKQEVKETKKIIDIR